MNNIANTSIEKEVNVKSFMKELKTYIDRFHLLGWNDEGFLQSPSRPAFTLAEVLITLGIIGIVAAMTLPGLTSGYRKNVATTQLKKAYSEINEAIKLSEIDNGEVANWAWCTEANYYDLNCQRPFFDKYFRPYLKIIKTEYRKNYSDDISGGYQFPYYTLANGAKISIISCLSWSAPARYGYGQFRIYTTNNEKVMAPGRNVFSFHLKPYSNGVRLEPIYWEAWQCQALAVPSGRNYIVNNCGKLEAGNSKGITPAVYCTFLIYCNNWQVPDYYPIKF